MSMENLGWLAIGLFIGAFSGCGIMWLKIRELQEYYDDVRERHCYWHDEATQLASDLEITRMNLLRSNRMHHLILKEIQSTEFSAN